MYRRINYSRTRKLNNQETMQNSRRKVIVGMSGGVDSSVAALLCLDSGYEVEGLFMKNWDEDDGSEYCNAKEDLEDARSVCKTLGIKLNQSNFSSEYWDGVFRNFLKEYRAGRTPNPDVLCNREIKFKVFAKYAKLLGAHIISTGHYARLQKINGKIGLYKATDKEKDQSYFLQSVSQAQFKDVCFPLGELQKSEVRKIAQQNGLATHSKKDSTGICFIGERRLQDFLINYLPAQPGEIVDQQGAVLGEHQGLMFYTLGQRQGLKIGGKKGGAEKPWYVIKKSKVNNQIVVAQGNDNPALYCSAAYLESIFWITEEPVLPKKLAVKVRYRQDDQECVLEVVENRFLVKFKNAQRAVTPGQWACFYFGEQCLGGGIVASTLQ